MKSSGENLAAPGRSLQRVGPSSLVLEVAYPLHAQDPAVGIDFEGAPKIQAGIEPHLAAQVRARRVRGGVIGPEPQHVHSRAGLLLPVERPQVEAQQVAPRPVVAPLRRPAEYRQGLGAEGEREGELARIGQRGGGPRAGRRARATMTGPSRPRRSSSLPPLPPVGGSPASRPASSRMASASPPRPTAAYPTAISSSVCPGYSPPSAPSSSPAPPAPPAPRQVALRPREVVQRVDRVQGGQRPFGPRLVAGQSADHRQQPPGPRYCCGRNPARVRRSAPPPPHSPRPHHDLGKTNVGRGPERHRAGRPAEGVARVVVVAQRPVQVPRREVRRRVVGVELQRAPGVFQPLLVPGRPQRQVRESQ